MAFWGELGKGILNTLSGGLISGGVGAGLGAISAAQAQKNALALLKEQESAQSRLNQENAELGYNYGEMSAGNAHNRQLQLYNMQKEDQSAEAQIEDLKKAGLSIGLLYGGGGAGGTGGGSTKGAQGDGAGALGTQAPNYLEVEAAKQQRKLADAELARTVNESSLIKAERDKLEAETRKIDEERKTSEELTPVQKALLEQEGVSKWIDNARKNYENSGGNQTERRTPKHVEEHGLFGILNIGEEGQFNRRQAAEIGEIVSNTELNNEKKKGYWQELLNATAREETEKAKAAAIKLAAEWSTGEYTNWKTWTEAANNAVGSLQNIITKAIK